MFGIQLKVGLALGVILFITLFWRLGEPSFWDPDEAVYAEVTRELVASGDWWAPFYNGQPFFDKPIVFYWLQALPMAAGLDSELSARLAPACAGVLLVLATLWLGVQLASVEVGVIAALMLATNAGMLGLARYAILDLPFTLFLFSGIAALAVAMLRRQRLEYPGYVLIGLATAVKGPVALVLCGVAFMLIAAVSREARRKLLALQWVRGFLLAAAIGAPWPLYMWWRFGDAFIRGYALDENLLLYATPMYGGQRGWWFYLNVLAAGMLPWTVMLPARLVELFRERRIPAAVDLFDVLLWCWVASIVGFFSLSQFKLDHYVFPAAPALCLICARAWVRWRDAENPALLVRTSLGLVGVTLIVAGLAIAIASLVVLDLPRRFLVVPAVLIGAGIDAVVRYSRGRRLPWAPVAPIAAMAVLYAGIVVYVFPRLETGKVVPAVARWIDEQAPETTSVGAFRMNRWSSAFRFYVDRRVTRLETEEEARQFFAEHPDAFGVMTGESLEVLAAAGVPLQVLFEREGRWVTSGKALWRAPERPTRFVVVAKSAGDR
ncbi:MAG: ArnT family glycosyltransferase [Vicinamibacterales bacterium]